MENNTVRPCLVNGEKAIFHKWVDRERIIMKDNNIRSEDTVKRIYDRFLNTQIVPKGLDINKIKDEVAIVEFEDGCVKEVNPENVRFLDSRDLFNDFQEFFDSVTVGVEIEV